jgi:hypothetical protein
MYQLLWLGESAIRVVIEGDPVAQAGYLAARVAGSVWRGPNVAMAAAMVLWAARVVTILPSGGLPLVVQRVPAALWSTNVLTVGVAALIAVAALLWFPRRMPPQVAGE